MGGDARFLAADLADLEAVRGLAEAVATSATRLDLLINNAGIGAGGSAAPRRVNAAGCELRFRGQLSRRICADVAAAAAAQAQRAGAHRQRRLARPAGDRLRRRHADARLFRRPRLHAEQARPDPLHVRSRARLKGSGTTVNCLHPATYMATTMVREAGATPLSTVEEGGAAILNLAVSPALEDQSGLYFNGLAKARPNAQADDGKARARLWALSLQLTGLTDEGV